MGLVIAALSAALIRLVVPPGASIFGIAAPLCGIALGGFLAGKLAKNAGAYQGALVGVGYVLVEAIGLAPAPFEPSGDGFGDTVAVIAGDAMVLALGALAGWLAAPRATSSSSSDMGKGR